jgi:hypothetical protein
MLATSSSDDEDYDKKKPAPKPVKSQPQQQTSTFLSAQQKGVAGLNNNYGPNNSYYSQPSTPNMSVNRNNTANSNLNNAMANVNLNGDNVSVRSSISASSENISLNNYPGNGGNRNSSNNNSNTLNSNNYLTNTSHRKSTSSFQKPGQPNIQNRTESIKSNSSSSTLGGPGGGSLMPNSNHSNLNTPRTPRKTNRSTGRQMPKRPGDNTSFTSSYNDRNGDYDSDNSDYNYDSHYANQNNNNLVNRSNYQNSDDEYSETTNNGMDNDGANSIDPYDKSNAMNDDNDSAIVVSHRSKGRNKNQEDKESAAAAAAAAALAAQQNEALKEIEMHKKRLQIYVFVCRCIAYPFIAKQPTDMVRRQAKISKQQLQQIKDNFDAFLLNKINIVEADEAFTNAVRSYYEVFLKSDRVTKMVLSGGCSASDFRDVFKNNIEKRVRSLPEIDGLSKETVLTSWMNKFDTIFRHNEEHTSNNVIANRRQSRNHLNSSNNPMSSECILTKEQLYEMFQNILGIKKFEHQLIFNAAQVSFVVVSKQLVLVFNNVGNYR